MSQKLDLNKLRDVVMENASSGASRPADSSKQVFVDKEANLILGDTVRGGKPAAATEVLQGTFSASSDEERFVREKMPRGTKHVTSDEGTKGWVYTFTSSLGDRFELFAYRDGAFWQVLLLLPEVEEHFKSVHSGHLFKDGRICLSEQYAGGAPDLATAYARSVLWATGMSVALRTGIFAFDRAKAA